ncbi:uncharacterized protein LOC135121286 [Zophobas morio]|uniref:uncharacterized protein LOC135121286 n=1 Tax=Zophobas morio TaxID=2755281 RepID=UPI003083C219
MLPKAESEIRNLYSRNIAEKSINKQSRSWHWSLKKDNLSALEGGLSLFCNYQRIFSVGDPQVAKSLLLNQLFHPTTVLLEVSRLMDLHGWPEIFQNIKSNEISHFESILDERGGSLSALGSCAYRLCAFRLGFGPDYLSRIFFDSSNKPESWLEEVKVQFEQTGFLCYDAALLGGEANLRKEQLKKPFLFLDMIAFTQTRTCFIDDVMSQFFLDFPNKSNTIILGAGYDTRFYRLPIPLLANLYELDLKTTQLAKKRVLTKRVKDSWLYNKRKEGDPFAYDFRDVNCADNLVLVDSEVFQRVVYLECDLTRENFLLKLKDYSSFSIKLPTLIVLEGVSYYLLPECFENILKIIKQYFYSMPCALVFDYATKRHLVFQEKFQSRRSKEPWLFGLESKDMRNLLRFYKLYVYDHISCSDGLEYYLPKRDQGSVSLGGAEKTFILAVNKKFLKFTRKNKRKNK